jgi:predicted nuclease of predicted toxin-antitoxin system
MKLFLDECVSPRLAEWLCTEGYDAIHPLHIGRRGQRDDEVLRRCIEEDRIIITENAVDFLSLVGDVEIHPGLIVLPCVDRATCKQLLEKLLKFLEKKKDHAEYMINRVLEIDLKEKIESYELPR